MKRWSAGEGARERYLFGTLERCNAGALFPTLWSPLSGSNSRSQFLDLCTLAERRTDCSDCTSEMPEQTWPRWSSCTYPACTIVHSRPIYLPSDARFQVLIGASPNAPSTLAHPCHISIAYIHFSRARELCTNHDNWTTCYDYPYTPSSSQRLVFSA